MRIVGLDIGSNSVGSAWVDTKERAIRLAVSVFPAGVDEQDDKRGAPKNQARRLTRSQRRNLDRRARRKRALRAFLAQNGLLPTDPAAEQELLNKDAWALRRRALSEPVSPHEFGRILLHLDQRRGAVGVTTDPDDPEEGKVKEGMDRLAALMKQRNAQTLGQLIADLADERTHQKGAVSWREPVRNRQYRMAPDLQLYAGRDLVRAEFARLVEEQRKYGTELSKRLTEELVRKLDDPSQSHTWRHSGLLFGQRRTYWNIGTLGRCVLEPTERCVPLADRHAGLFRVIETVNNIRIEQRGQPARPLTVAERDKVIAMLRGPLFKKVKGKAEPKSSASVTDIKLALGIAPRDPMTRLNIEADEDREINTDWFHREIVHGVFTEAVWEKLTEQQRESVNLAILKYDPEQAEDAEVLRAGAGKWWGLSGEQSDKLIETWKRRPKLEARLNLSRRAIVTLLPLMGRFDATANRWPTQQEARKFHAKTLPEGQARIRYETGAAGLKSSDRYYMKLAKHQIAPGIPELPPAPTLANPVVRKAIHEVRRHLIAWMRKFGVKPDRVVIEMARSTKESQRQRDAALKRNRFREKIRKQIIAEILPAAFGKEAASRLSLNQQRAAVDRVLLARQQTGVCPYCGNSAGHTITDRVAAKGDDLETDHIQPYSRCGDNGMNNRVIVHKNCNQTKGNRAPREWWGASFEQRIRHAERLFKETKPSPGEYFDHREYARKWENFNREIKQGAEWKNSQLSDTAYAAREVASYIADALFDGGGLPERGAGGSEQKIFFTMGRFTSTLRRDWQLFETVKSHDNELSAAQERALAEKDRGDHRQHAIDALAIALTSPGIKNDLAAEAVRAAEYREKHGKWPTRTPIPPPWGTVREFREQVISQVYGIGQGTTATSTGSNPIAVSPRPVKRRLIGALHRQTLYGAVIDDAGRRVPDRVTARQPIYESPQSCIKPDHLRPPFPEPREASISRIAMALRGKGVAPREAKKRASELVGEPGFNPPLVDPSPGLTGIVRDRALRAVIRQALNDRGIDPDRFKSDDLRHAIESGGPLCHASGVPIKSAVLILANSSPIIYPRRRFNPLAGRMESDPDPRSLRLYDGQNNHHIEIRVDKEGNWYGKVITADEAMKRVRPRRLPDGSRPKPGCAVDRSDGEGGRFVMSLAEGEAVHMRHPATGEAGYFVVFKIDGTGAIHFKHHWDARRAKGSKDDDGNLIPGTTREDVGNGIVPGRLQLLGLETDKPPVKVHVSPLGEVTPLQND